jgi:hypothetical protein
VSCLAAAVVSLAYGCNAPPTCLRSKRNAAIVDAVQKTRASLLVLSASLAVGSICTGFRALSFTGHSSFGLSQFGSHNLDLKSLYSIFIWDFRTNLFSSHRIGKRI